MEKEEFIKLVKEEGLSKAFSVSSREDNAGWLCPSCKAPVIITGEREYETLSEHVSNPNMKSYPLRDTYQCSDENCITRKSDIFWDHYGDRYGTLINNEGEKIYYGYDEKYFINGNDAPFGSHSRQANVEISGVGQKRNTYLHPALCLWFLQPMIEYNYDSNRDGDILKTRWSIKFLKKDKYWDKGGFSTYFTPCWETWSYLNDRKNGFLKDYRKTGAKECLERFFEESFNRAWVYRWHEKYLKLRYWRLYKIIK